MRGVGYGSPPFICFQICNCELYDIFDIYAEFLYDLYTILNELRFKVIQYNFSLRCPLTPLEIQVLTSFNWMFGCCLYHLQFFSYLCKDAQTSVQVTFLMSGGDHDTDPGFSLRHGWETDSHPEYSSIVKLPAETLG